MRFVSTHFSGCAAGEGDVQFDPLGISMPRNDSSIVLIIEEDAPTLELYRRELGRDYQILACQNGEDAIRLAGWDGLSAIVLEPAMGGGQGWLLLPHLQQALVGRHVPIILCSTQDEPRRGMLAGASAFLVKPVLPVVLRDCIQRVLESSKG